MMLRARPLLRTLAVILCLAIAPTIAAATDREVTGVLDAFVEAVTSGDSEALGALYAESAHFEDVTLGQVYDGRAAIEQSWFTLLGAHVEPPRLEVNRRIATPGHGVLELIYRGRIDGALVGAPGTTRDYELSMVALLEIEDGRIVRQTDYLDLDRYRELLAPAPSNPAPESSR